MAAGSDRGSSRQGSSAQGSSMSGAGGERKKKERSEHKGAVDLDEKKSAEEALHASMYALVKEKGAEPWQFTGVKIVMEGLVGLLILFNPDRLFWAINQDQWLWKIVRWSVFKSPIALLYGYNAFCTFMFVLVAIVFAELSGVAFLAWSMRKSEQSPWLKTLAKTLQIMSDVLFSVLYMSILDYFLFFSACDFSATPIMHVYFTNVYCMAMPHLAYMAIAGATAVLFCIATIAVQTASCDLNPTAKGVMASPAAMMKIKVVFAKAIYILAMNAFDFMPKPQALLVAVMVLYVVWLNFKTAPFLRAFLNYVWVGMWCSVLFASGLYTALAFSPSNDQLDTQTFYTNMVLYGVWPALLVGGLATWAFLRHRLANAAKFRDPSIDPAMDKAKLRKVHRFASPGEVELVCRAMRKFDRDGNIDPGAADLGELVIKAGLATFPNNPQLLILYGNFLMDVRGDGPASRTQLQLVAKQSPNFVERYQVFCTAENSKRLKESSDQGMDLHSYVEFKRMFRGVMRVHKDALMQIRELWHVASRADPRTARLDAAVKACDAAIDRAQRIYRKVVERYPKNGRLLKVYGSFLEDVKSDFRAATRVYALSVRQGGASNGLMSMNFDFASQPGKPDMLTSMDINEDAIVMINAEGHIMLVSAGVTPLFGYAKAELEGQNVAMLMPALFNQRHHSYLQRYKETGQARVLDTVKEVVALHKDKHVFPVQTCVTKLSGVGADAVFLGVMRPLAFSKRDVRAWLAPNGVIMCCGPMFSALTGIAPEEMVGANIKTMIAEADDFEALLQRSATATAAEFASHALAMDITLLNKYVGHVPCRVHFSMGGTEQTRVFVMHIARKEEADDNLLVVDEQGNITFATIDLAVTLGYTLKNFLKLNLRQIVPPPVNAMHERWLLDSPPSYPITSCRAGCVVHLLGSTNQQVAVRLQLSQREEPSGLKHVCRVIKCDPHEFMDDRRVMIVAGYDGIIISVEPENAIFGFPTAMLKGLSVCDVIDVFSDWREKSGSGDMQLLMLALLDKEHEMPGAAWRIKLTPPDAAHGGEASGEGRSIMSVNHKRMPKSAIMQTSLVETARRNRRASQMTAQELAWQKSHQELMDAHGHDKPKIRLTLWRRELLVGSMELDSRLKVRRADQNAGLIMGRPAGVILKQPLWKLFNIPRRAGWDELMGLRGASRQQSVLKTAPTMGKVSAIKAFEGDHPDGGSMRILVQGVVITDAMNGKSRIEITTKPDMTFAAAHSDIWSALGLNRFDGGEELHGSDRGSGSRHSSHSGSSRSSGAATPPVRPPVVKGTARFALPKDEETDAGGNKQGVAVGQTGRSSGSGGGGGQAGQAGDGDLIKRWVQTMDATTRPNSLSGKAQDGAPRHASSSLSGGSAAAKAGGDAGRGDAPGGGGEADNADWLKIAATMPDEALSMPPPASHKGGNHHGGGGGHQHHGGSHGSEGDPSEADDSGSEQSSAHGDEQRSAISSKVEAHGDDEILVDSRRFKVLRKLLSTLTLPSMRGPVQNIKVRTCVILALMLLVRVVFYIVTAQLMAQQAVYINQVHETAGCADRSQLITARTGVATYCRDSPALIAGDNICHTSAVPSTALHNIELNILDLEAFSQDVYLGQNGKVTQLSDPTTYNAWSDSNIQFTVYLDTAPPTTLNATRSLFELNNRFAAAARELLWLIDYQNTTDIIRSRAYNFVSLNGMDTMFNAYTHALDALMVFSWDQLSAIKEDIAVLMVLEALVVMPLLMFWMWHLIRAAEGVRTVQYMLLVLLPAPVLRTLSTRPVTITEDSDADSDAGSDAGEERARAEDAKGADDSGPQAIQAAQPPSSRSSAAPFGSESEMLMRAQQGAGGGSGGAVTVQRDGERPPKRERRRVAPALKHYLLFLGPLALWFVALLVIYGISLSEITSLQQPLAALNMAMHVIYRFSHVRALAFFLCTQSTHAATDVWRAKMVTAVSDLTSEYETLMYGGVATTQANDMFQQPVPAAAFILPSFSAMFFSDTNCMRANQSTCYTPDSPWYEATHHGLDAMMQRIISEMGLMTQDSYADLNIANNTRYQTMYHIGIADLYDGLQTASQLFVDYSISRYQQITLFQTILLVVLLVIAALYLLFVLRPYLALHRAAVGKIAGVASHAPFEADIASHARRVVRHGVGYRKKTAGQRKLAGDGQAQQEEMERSSVASSQMSGAASGARWS